jgi:glycosyltransferase involved in cell wall biosynthesis
MRVLVANNYYYMRGGCERVMFNDIRALLDRRVDVVPFSTIDPANVPTEYSADFARGVDIHATTAMGRLGAAVEAIHSRRTAEAFGALVEKTRPDIVHCHNIYGRLTTSILAVARRRAVPTVLTVHDYKLVCPSYLMLLDGRPCNACMDGGYYRCVVHRCHKHSLAASAVYAAEAYFTRLSDQYAAVSAFLCPSHFMADLLIQAGVDRKRILYHPNCVDPDVYPPSYELGEYVLYAGRLSREKGISTLIEAVNGLNIPLRIAGTGPMEERVQALASADGRSNVVCEGHCDGKRLAQLYRNAAFVVVPSEWYENAPMAVLEAFAYGKPVVASRIGGLPELVEDGETGYLVECGDREQLRTALSGLWSDRRAQLRMGQNARRLVETRYSQDQRTASLLSVYDGIRTTTN